VVQRLLIRTLQTRLLAHAFLCVGQMRLKIASKSKWLARLIPARRESASSIVQIELASRRHGAAATYRPRIRERSAMYPRNSQRRQKTAVNCQKPQSEKACAVVPILSAKR